VLFLSGRKHLLNVKLSNMSNADAKKILDCMATASTTIREAIAKALPVAPTQLMTVQIPGTVLELEYVASMGIL
jgi:hypothetical protein